SADLQALDLVLPARAGGEDEDREALPGLAQGLDQVHARHLGQAQVDHGDVEGHFPAVIEAFLAVGGGVHGKAFALQARGQGLAQGGFILDQQYAHVVSFERGGPRGAGVHYQSSRRRGSCGRPGRRAAGPRGGEASISASRLPRISIRSRSAASRARERSRSMLPLRGKSSGSMRSRGGGGGSDALVGSRGVSSTRTRPSGVSTLIR